MKKIIFLVVILINTLGYSQHLPKFRIETNNELNTYIVVNLEVTTTARKIYDKALKWAEINYKDAEEAIRFLKDKETIIIDGRVVNGVCINTCDYDLKYKFEISFKDGRYKFEYKDLKVQLIKNRKKMIVKKKL